MSNLIGVSRSLLVAGVISLTGSLLMSRSKSVSLTPRWPQFGQNSQHSAVSPVALQPMNRIKWSTPVDLNPQYSGDSLLIHYGSPVISASNTVIVPVKTGASSGFRFEAHNGSDGSLKWSQDTDYILPPHDWVPSANCVLSPDNRLYYVGSGGRLHFVDSPDANSAARSGTVAFYGAAAYATNPGVFDSTVFINTPLTCDDAGNVFFGVQVTGSNPANLKGSIVKVRKDGTAIWKAAASVTNDVTMLKPVHNCTPALSPDQLNLYVAINNGNGYGAGFGYLACVKTTDLTTVGKSKLTDPMSGNLAYLHDDGTASPTVGPDGCVYFGVLENPFYSNHLRGYLRGFGAKLKSTKKNAAFGWDDTPSIVPASIVTSYHGTSSYLLLIKYNNYVEGGGDGVNKLAIVDPNVTWIDPIKKKAVMKEVLTVVGPSADPNHRDANHPNAVREWCINSGAVDAATHSIVVNNEDGKAYRWNLDTNTLTSTIQLAAPTGEAYTMTIIGPDGTAYAINNGRLFAIGQ